MTRARADRVPLLDRVAAGRPGRPRARERRRARLLRPARRRVARSGHPALPDALPLGPAAGARGRRRLDVARHRGRVRRVRRGRRGAARRPRLRLDDAQRALRPGSATPRASCARPNRPRDGLAAAHHVLLSHGLALDVLRRACPQARVGIVLDSWPTHAASDDRRDVAAAGSGRRAPQPPLLRPACCGGAYPAEVFDALDVDGDVHPGRDLKAIAAPIDFVGVNNYSRTVVAADPETGEPVEVPVAGAERTGLGWEVYPDGLYEVLTRLHRDYGVPLALRDRERRRVPRHASTTARSTTPSARVPRAATSAPSHARSRTASRCAATSSGRCSTTSSGRTATRSGSGSSTSTTRRSNGSRSRASAGTAT